MLIIYAVNFGVFTTVKNVHVMKFVMILFSPFSGEGGGWVMM